ncbi:MAG: polysaccharide pyruvyl transferase family protein [Alphaproteobacteria bacterium]|jgi:polysaccharide pyruvyl transferase WcaK-like protein
MKRVLDRLRNWKRRLMRVHYSHKAVQYWAVQRQNPLSIPAKKRLLIVPCDPWSVTGSRGDEAMIEATLEHFPDYEVGVVTSTPEATKNVMAKGWIPLESWRGPVVLKSIVESAEFFAPEYCAVLGADCMDGFYSPEASLILMAIPDILRVRGVKTSLLGFSFNDHPVRKVIRGFGKVDGSFVFNLRDSASKERFEIFTGRSARLVADVAFLLKPDFETEQFHLVSQWKLRLGGKVLAVNLHPMLIHGASKEVIDEQINVLAQVLGQIIHDTNWNILLIPHDFRQEIGDNACLAPLYKYLSKDYSQRICHVSDELSAAQIKGIISLADALLTSRMHLGIGALSQGIPVISFQYQGKFQGLLKHFNLPESLILPLPQQVHAPSLQLRLMEFLENSDYFRQQIVGRLPEVVNLARLNLSFKSNE